MKKFLFGVCLSAMTCSTLSAMYAPPNFNTRENIQKFESWGQIISASNRSRGQIELVFNQIIELLQSTTSERMPALIQLIKAHIKLNRLFAVYGESESFAHALLTRNLFGRNDIIDRFSDHLLLRVNETDNLGNSVLSLLIKSGLPGYNVALKAVSKGHANLLAVDGEGRSALHLAAEHVFLIPRQNIPDYRLLHAILDRCLSNPALSRLVSKWAHYSGPLACLDRDLEESFDEDILSVVSGEHITDPISVLLSRPFLRERPVNPKHVDLSLFLKILRLMPDGMALTIMIDCIYSLSGESSPEDIIMTICNDFSERLRNPLNTECVSSYRNSSGMSVLDWFLEKENFSISNFFDIDHITLHLSTIKNSVLLKNVCNGKPSFFRLIECCERGDLSLFLVETIIRQCPEILFLRGKKVRRWYTALEHSVYVKAFNIARVIAGNPNWNPAGENYDFLVHLVNDLPNFWRPFPEKREAAVLQLAKTIAETRELDLKGWDIEKNLEVLLTVVRNFGDRLLPENRLAIEAAIRQAGG
jgi:hypothetical protein